MEGNSKKSRAILVFGAPCSGKTTFCENFAKRFHAPYFNLTHLSEKYNLSRELLLMLVEQLAKTSQTLIIEGGLETEKDRNEIRTILLKAQYQPSLIWIQTDISTIKARLKLRTKSASKAKAEYSLKAEMLEAPSDIEQTIVISGKHTFETQLKHVLSQLA